MSYQSQKSKELEYSTGLQTGVLHWWAILCMSNTTVGNAQTTDVVSGLSLDEFDGAAYVRKQLGGVSITRVDGSKLVKVICNLVVWSTLGVGSRPISGVEVYIDPDGTNNDNNNIHAFWFTNGFPRTPDGSDFPWGPNASGLVYSQG